MYKSLITLAILTFLSGPLLAEEEKKERARPIYLSMLPHFTVNLSDGDVPRFLMLKAQTQLKNKETKTELLKHMPAVRHNILMKLSSLTRNDLQSTAKKEKLKTDITEIIRETLTEYGEYDDVKDFFITSFVMQ